MNQPTYAIICTKTDKVAARISYYQQATKLAIHLHSKTGDVHVVVNTTHHTCPPKYRYDDNALTTMLDKHEVMHGQKLAGALYLRLLHGRDNVGQQMQGNGFEGPTIGPLLFCHVTYSSAINLGFVDGDETGPMVGDDPLTFDGDLLKYKGAWYGDWELGLCAPF